MKRPNFTLTLLRTPFLPPDHATFIVPLNLNKLDIKDYLYHAYDVRVISVRSYVQQQRVQQDKERAYDPKRNRWFRPRSIKKMTVQMDKGFVWPEEPTDFKPSVAVLCHLHLSLGILSSSSLGPLFCPLDQQGTRPVSSQQPRRVLPTSTPPSLSHISHQRLTPTELNLELENTDGTRVHTP